MNDKDLERELKKKKKEADLKGYFRFNRFCKVVKYKVANIKKIKRNLIINELNNLIMWDSVYQNRGYYLLIIKLLRAYEKYDKEGVLK